MESCRLWNCTIVTWEVTFEKMALGKYRTPIESVLYQDWTRCPMLYFWKLIIFNCCFIIKVTCEFLLHDNNEEIIWIKHFSSQKNVLIFHYLSGKGFNFSLLKWRVIERNWFLTKYLSIYLSICLFKFYNPLRNLYVN